MQKKWLIIPVFFSIFLAGSSLVSAADKVMPKPTVPNEPVKSARTSAPGGFFSEKKDLMDLIADDNAASDIVLDAAWGRHNPFNGAIIAALPAPTMIVKPAKAPGNRNFVLAGIIWSVARPSAVINDQVLGVGAVIDGMTVKEIKENNVTLSDGTDQVVLTLHQ